MPDGSLNTKLEEFYSGIEGVGSHFFRELLRISRSGEIPKLDEGAWEFFGLYSYYQMKRIPHALDSALNAPEVVAVREAELKRLEAAGETFTHDELANAEKLALIYAQASAPSDEVIEMFKSLGLAIYKASDPRKSFILGDSAIASAVIGGNAGSGRITFLPVAPDTAVGFLNEKRVVRRFDLSAFQVRRINEALTASSRVIAGNSLELIASLSRAVPYAG